MQVPVQIIVPRGSERGFTMVELMVTVAIIGILAAVAVPAVGRTIRRDQVRKAARVSAEIFEEYRSEAAATGRAMYISIEGNSGGYHYTRVWAQPGATCSVLTAGELQYADADFFASGTAAVIPHDPNTGLDAISVCAHPNGRLYEVSGGFETPVSQPLTIDVYDWRNTGAEHYLVRVQPTGIARVY